MSGAAESAAIRLWRDRADIRERERNEAQAQVRIADQKVAILIAENDRLEAENERLRKELDGQPALTGGEIAMQMEALRCALSPMLV